MNVYCLALLASAGAAMGFLAVIVVSPTTSSATEATEAPPPRVKIAHEFVRIQITGQESEALKAANGQIRVLTPPAPTGSAAVAGAAKSTPRAGHVGRRGQSSIPPARSGILPRVGRLLAGDGRHRPEPFPQPGQ